MYGDVSDVLAKYPRSSDVVWDQGLTAEKALELGKAEIAREKAERAARQPVFDVDPNRMVFVRLNEFANVQNPDFKIPWGVTDWRGMRFDFIRFDQNQFKDVIKVEKPVKGIAVDSRAAFLYFAHAAAPVYRVVYDDKTSVEVDAKSGQEVVGWKDGEGHKYCVRRDCAAARHDVLRCGDYRAETGAEGGGVSEDRPLWRREGRPCELRRGNKDLERGA